MMHPARNPVITFPVQPQLDDFDLVRLPPPHPFEVTPRLDQMPGLAQQVDVPLNGPPADLQGPGPILFRQHPALLQGFL